MHKEIARVLGTAIAAAGVLAALPAQAQALEPTGDWQVRQDAEHCRARRDFGPGGEFLQLRTFGPGSAVEVTVGRHDLPRDPFKGRRVELGWDGEEMSREHLAILGVSGGVPTATLLMAYRPSAIFFKGRVDKTIHGSTGLETLAETLRVKIPGSAPVELHSGPMEKALDGLAACERALLASWGWDEDYLERNASGPQMLDRGNFNDLIAYPGGAVVNHVSGYLQLRLKVDAAGKVTECIPQSSPGTAQFGTDTCKMALRKLRYSPARDRQGGAVESFAQISVAFAILG